MMFYRVCTSLRFTDAAPKVGIKMVNCLSCAIGAIVLLPIDPCLPSGLDVDAQDSGSRHSID